MMKRKNPYEVSVDRVVAGVEREVWLTAAQVEWEDFAAAVREAFDELTLDAKSYWEEDETARAAARRKRDSSSSVP